MAAPNMGTNGTNGVRNGRLRLGSVLRNIRIDIQTIVKAIKVPIETNSLNTCRGNNPANTPVIIQANTVAFCGT